MGGHLHCKQISNFQVSYCSIFKLPRWDGLVAEAMWFGCGGYVVWLWRLCGRVAEAMWWVTIQIIMPLCGPILQAETFQIFS